MGDDIIGKCEDVDDFLLATIFELCMNDMPNSITFHIEKHCYLPTNS